MQIPRTATSRANGQAAGKMSLGAGGECGDLFMAHMQPFDLFVPPQRIRKTIQAIANQAIDALDERSLEYFNHLIGNSFFH
jgi:hypothetical protein